MNSNPQSSLVSTSLRLSIVGCDSERPYFDIVANIQQDCGDEQDIHANIHKWLNISEDYSRTHQILSLFKHTPVQQEQQDPQTTLVTVILRGKVVANNWQFPIKELCAHPFMDMAAAKKLIVDIIDKKNATVSHFDWVHHTQLEPGMQQHESLVQQRESQVQQRESQVQQRESQVQQRESEVQQRESEVQQHESEVQQRESEVQQHESQVRGLNNDLEKLKEKSGALKNEVSSMQNSIMEEREDIARTRAEAQRLLEDALARAKKLAAKDKELKEREKKLESDEIAIAKAQKNLRKEVAIVQSSGNTHASSALDSASDDSKDDSMDDSKDDSEDDSQDDSQDDSDSETSRSGEDDEDTSKGEKKKKSRKRLSSQAKELWEKFPVKSRRVSSSDSPRKVSIGPRKFPPTIQELNLQRQTTDELKRQYEELYNAVPKGRYASNKDWLCGKIMAK